MYQSNNNALLKIKIMNLLKPEILMQKGLDCSRRNKMKNVSTLKGSFQPA